MPWTGSILTLASQVAELPASIGNLSALYRLGLKGNQLTRLPPEIRGLRSLVELFITNNKLESLPAEFGQLKSLVKLQVGARLQFGALNKKHKKHYKTAQVAGEAPGGARPQFVALRSRIVQIQTRHGRICVPGGEEIWKDLRASCKRYEAWGNPHGILIDMRTHGVLYIWERMGFLYQGKE
jgi:Leucine rich repeat